MPLRPALTTATAALATAAVCAFSAAPAQAAPARAAQSLRITAPSSVTAYANSSKGVRVKFTTTVTGASGSSVTLCFTPSNDVYALGRTTVTCLVTDAKGHSAKSTTVVRVRLRGGGFWAPLNVDGLVQKGDQLHPAFRVYAADKKTPLSDISATTLLSAHRVTLTVRQVGVSGSTSVPLTYDAARNVFRATVQTFDWVGGADYVLTYRVLGVDRSTVATKSVKLGVRLGA